jgi:hypothetical protein
MVGGTIHIVTDFAYLSNLGALNGADLTWRGEGCDAGYLNTPFRGRSRGAEGAKREAVKGYPFPY